MKNILVIALLTSGCSHPPVSSPVERPQAVVPSRDAETPQLPTRATEVEMLIFGPDNDEGLAMQPTEVVVPAALDHLRQVIDVTIQTEPALDDEQVALALDAIADALGALSQPDITSIDTIRTYAAMLRKMQGRTRADGRMVRRALDQSIVSLLVMQGDSQQGDVATAARAVRGISAKRSIMNQTPAIRVALCAVANAVSVEADTGRYGCIEHTRGTAEK